MELQKTKHQLRLEEWKTRVQACRNSGKTIKNWCKEQQINEQTYYRWQKLVWEAGTRSVSLTPCVPQAMTFAEYQPTVLKAESSGSVVVHLAGGKVEIQSGAEEETILATLRALNSLC